jgi:hypothetical protein
MRAAAHLAALLLLSLAAAPPRGLPGAAAARAGARPAARPDYSVYRTLAATLAEAEHLAAGCPPGWAATEVRELELGGYSAAVTVVTVEPGGLTSPAAREKKARLLLNFGEHGRELVSTEVGLALLAALCGGAPGRAALLAAHGLPAAEAEAALGRAVFTLVPLENAAGRARVEGGDLCERKNGRGVDPNRNWGVDWGRKEADYDPAEEFPGAAPFSEPEAALLRALAEERRPHVWLSVHSGMEALFTPFDHRPGTPAGAAGAATLRALAALNAAALGGRCAVGGGGDAVGYLAHGTATDWMHAELKVPIAMTWEVYGDDAAPYHDCFRMFNPLTREALGRVTSAWAAAALGLLAALPGHPGVPELADLPVAEFFGGAVASGGDGAVKDDGGEAAAEAPPLDVAGGSAAAGVRGWAAAVAPGRGLGFWAAAGLAAAVSALLAWRLARARLRGGRRKRSSGGVLDV